MINMKTNIFMHEINKIKLFCKHAVDGFIIIEVNDLISKSTIIEALEEEYDLFYLENLTVSTKDIQGTTRRIFIVDTFENDIEHIDFKRWAANINFNRDLLSNLGCVIFICTTRLVNELISFSSSFWSFVALHIKLNKKLDCIYSPIYIEIQNWSYFNNTYNEYIEKNINARQILKSSSSKTLINLLDKLWNECEGWFNYYKRVKQYGEWFYENRKYEYARICFKAIENKINFEIENVRLKIDVMNSLAGVYYRLQDYARSLFYLDSIRKISEDNSSFFSKYELAILWNNMGVVWLKCEKKQIHEALSCFDFGLKLINYAETNIIISEILYNACIVNYILGDYNQSQYYINLSMKLLQQNSKFHNIVSSRFSVIKAFVMINNGDFTGVIKMMTESLACLREELDEKHVYILEAHYTFALIYMHLGLFDKANKCITKALKNVKQVRNNYSLSVCVWALYGIIQYCLGNYGEAKNYFCLVRDNADKTDTNMAFYANAILKSM